MGGKYRRDFLVSFFGVAGQQVNASESHLGVKEVGLEFDRLGKAAVGALDVALGFSHLAGDVVGLGIFRVDLQRIAHFDVGLVPLGLLDVQRALLKALLQTVCLAGASDEARQRKAHRRGFQSMVQGHGMGLRF